MDLYKHSHYNLEELKNLIKNPETRVITGLARRNGFKLGLVSDEDFVEQVLKLNTTDLYKTMTCNHDHETWQDVYKPVIEGVTVYVKLQKANGKGVVIQFKLAEDD